MRSFGENIGNTLDKTTSRHKKNHDRIAADKKRMSFTVDVPLKEGANYVMVVARHDDKTVSATPVFVRRQGADR